MPETKSRSFTFLLVTDRKFKADKPVAVGETWKIVLAVNSETCKRPIIDPTNAVAVLQGVSLEGMPGDFLGRVERRVDMAGSSTAEYFYAIPGSVFIAHSHCPTPVGLQVPARTLLSVHSPVADYKPGIAMTDTFKPLN